MFLPYQVYTRFRSELLTNPSLLASPNVPSLEDLVALQNELQEYKQRAQQRANKAANDVQVLEDIWAIEQEDERVREAERAAARELKEKNRLKAREAAALNKAKREASIVEDLDDILAPPPPRGTGPPSRKLDDRRDNKKKRKRDKDRANFDEFEELMESAAFSSPNPPPERPPKKAKNSHPMAQLTIPAPLPLEPVDPDVATDFSLPPPPAPNARPILGLWDGENRLLRSMPTRNIDMNDDFTDAKATGGQTQIGPFWKEVDSWIRPIAEEDMTWVQHLSDDTEIFKLPPLGRHYTEVWEEQDQLLATQFQSLQSFDAPQPSATQSNFYPTSTQQLLPPPTHDPYGLPLAPPAPQPLTDADLPMEKKSLGSFTERVLSAMLVDPNAPLPPVKKEKKEDKDKDKDKENGDPNGVGANLNAPALISHDDMEARLKIELRSLGLLGAEEPDFSESQDDEIAAEIRTLQAQLRHVKKANDARKARLYSLAKDRLAYTEYLDMLENLNRQISNGHQRLVKNATPPAKDKKKRKVPGEKDKEGDKDKEDEKPKPIVFDVPEALLEKIALREKFKEVFGQAMKAWDAKAPGQLVGFPKESVYGDLKLDSEAEWDDSVITHVEVNT